MLKANPYRLGAGFMPMYLAGRDSDITEMERIFDALCLKIPTQSVIYSGLRGVGKTVLINQLQKVNKSSASILKWKSEMILFPKLPAVHKHSCEESV